ncbi:MAG TPA: 3'-5' exonuclease [Candidatus Eisenbergiella pullistercoris]|uniref:3'-5' exonuclease n=1 Tax=Candidatus Eisenbergiella pullistercoris TaxID=2838555 RepID=A0A9D2C6J9_9FIRM|nr:3'-5' exonuclease [Candidatus Eisenbergiella pullistercoris]
MLKSYLAFDVETTGLNPETDEIIEIGALKVRDGKVCERFISFVKPSEPVSERITQITGITNEMLLDAAPKERVIPAFLDFCGDEVLIGHNLPFDYGFVRNQAKLFGLSFEKQGIDTLKIARSVHKGRQSNSLEALCGRYSIVNSSAHRAYHDALATAKLYQTLAHFYESFQPQLFLPAPLSVLSGAPGTSAGTGAADAPATPKQIGFLSRLAAQKRLTVTWDAQKLTKSQASGLIEKILAGEQP